VPQTAIHGGVHLREGRRVAEPLWKHFLGHNISGREIGWCGWLSEKSPKCVAVTAVVVKGDENRPKKCQK
jgi:hypothetical protein